MTQINSKVWFYCRLFFFSEYIYINVTFALGLDDWKVNKTLNILFQYLFATKRSLVYFKQALCLSLVWCSCCVFFIYFFFPREVRQNRDADFTFKNYVEKNMKIKANATDSLYEMRCLALLQRFVMGMKNNGHLWF